MQTQATGDPANKWAAVFGPPRKSTVPSPEPPSTDGAPPSGGLKAAAMNAANPAILATGALVAVEAHLVDILAAGMGQSRADTFTGDRAVDGSLALDSMRAVFVCSIVAATLGPGGIDKFRGNSKAKDFKSIRSVATLVCRLRKAVVPA